MTWITQNWGNHFWITQILPHHLFFFGGHLPGDGRVLDNCPRTNNKHQPFSWVLCYFHCLTADGLKFYHRWPKMEKFKNFHPISTLASFEMNWIKTFSINVKKPQIWPIFCPPWEQIICHGAENLIISKYSPNKDTSKVWNELNESLFSLWPQTSDLTNF